MDYEKLLAEALEIQQRDGVTLSEAIKTAVCDHLQQVAGTWTIQAENLHIREVKMIARAAGHAVEY